MSEQASHEQLEQLNIPAINSYAESFNFAQSTLNELFKQVTKPSRISQFDEQDPKLEKMDFEPRREAYVKAIKALRSIPREHLLLIASRAVSERNSDDLDQNPNKQRSATFNEGILLSFLTPEEKEQIGLKKE
jgi:hypothetical protein